MGGGLLAGSLCTIVGQSRWNLLLCVCSGIVGAQRESPSPPGGGGGGGGGGRGWGRRRGNDKPVGAVMRKTRKRWKFSPLCPVYFTRPSGREPAQTLWNLEAASEKKLDSDWTACRIQGGPVTLF